MAKAKFEFVSDDASIYPATFMLRVEKKKKASNEQATCVLPMHAR